MQIHDWSVALVRRPVSAHRHSGDLWHCINGAFYSHLRAFASEEACFPTEKGAGPQAGLVENRMDAKRPSNSSTPVPVLQYIVITCAWPLYFGIPREQAGERHKGEHGTRSEEVR